MEIRLEGIREIETLFENKNISTLDQVSQSYEIFVRLNEEFKSLNAADSKICAQHVERLADGIHPALRLLTVSFLLHVTRSEKYLEELTLWAENRELDLSSRVFLYWQIKSKLFNNTHLGSFKFNVRVRKLHKDILSAYERKLPKTYDWIPASERNNHLVVVMTNQFIALRHGPTQTALDRCHTLQTTLNKEVFLINTAEMPRRIVLPLFEPVTWSFEPNGSTINSLRYLGTDIAFHQCRNEMPNIEEMTGILDFIAENRPGFVFSVGGNNFTADLCNKIVPVATQGCVNGMPVSEGNFLLPWRELTDRDMPLLHELGIDKERIIASSFTFRIQEQTKHFTRTEFNIPEKSYVLAVVGGRLDTEVGDEFTESLIELLKRNDTICIVFAGQFNGYEKFKSKHNVLQNQTRFVGFQDDIMAIYELCDGYLNPPRTGGGTSAVEAMYKGLPVFTYPIGDVAHDAGERYHIKSLLDIEQFMAKWLASPEFREGEKEIAQARANTLTDTHQSLANVIAKMEQSKYY